MTENITISLTKDELQSLLIDCFTVCLKHSSTNHQQPFEPVTQLMTIQQAAAFLSLSVPTIYGHVHNGLIPHSKKGKRLYFSQLELSEWIAQGRKKTTAELAAEAQTYINRKTK